jgi:CRP/FNR family transcriptional regulator
MNILAALRGTELFRDLNPRSLSALAGKAVERRLARDEILFLTGQPAAGLYVIVAGSVRAYRTGNDGREQVIHTEQAGATIGELPVFDNQPYPSTVAADEDSVVLFIDKESVHQLCQAYPDIAMAALRVLSQRLRKCAALVETLSLRPVAQRLALWFLTEARNRGHQAGEALEVEIPLSREQIAARVGSVREVVSRAIARLEQEGLIHIDGHRIRILDVHRLEEYSGGESRHS